MIIIVFVVWAIFAPLDDVVKAGVLLRPSQNVSSVRCVSSGELATKNYLNDDLVREGDLLFELDTTAYKAELEAYSKELQKNEEEICINSTLLFVIETSVLQDLDVASDAYIKAVAYVTEKKRYETSLADLKTKLEREISKPKTLRLPQDIQDLQNQLEQNELAFDSWKTNQKLSTIENLKQLKTSGKSIESHISELDAYRVQKRTLER